MDVDAVQVMVEEQSHRAARPGHHRGKLPFPACRQPAHFCDLAHRDPCCRNHQPLKTHAGWTPTLDARDGLAVIRTSPNGHRYWNPPRQLTLPDEEEPSDRRTMMPSAGTRLSDQQTQAVSRRQLLGLARPQPGQLRPPRTDEAPTHRITRTATSHPAPARPPQKEPSERYRYRPHSNQLRSVMPSANADALLYFQRLPPTSNTRIPKNHHFEEDSARCGRS